MILRTLLLTGLMISLNGCGKWLNDHYYTSDRLQARDWAAHGPVYHPQPVYCYKSLAGVNCYEDPQPGRRNQLVESYQEQRHPINLEDAIYSADAEPIEMNPIP